MAVLQKEANSTRSTARAGHEEIVNGLPFSALESFEKNSGLTADAIQKVLALTPRLRAKRKEQKRLTPFEAERLVRLARIVELATELHEGNRQQAARWLESPSRVFSGETPIDRAVTEVGARDVESLIGRLEHGVYT